MALDEAGVQLIAQGVAAYVSDMNKADQSTTGFYKTLGESDKSAGAFQEVITGALRHVGVALVEFGVQGAKAIGGFVKDSVGLAGEFESGMLNFQAVAGKDVDAKGLEDFRDLFLDIGKRLPVSTSEVQQAATEMVKGGIDPATIAAGGLESSIKFAAAAMEGDLTGAAEISAKVVGGWADVNATAAQKADLLTHSQDLLTKAANASVVGVEDLALGLYNVQGTAKSMGIGLDETVTTLSLLAPSFSSANTAGTSYRTFLSRLIPTTDKARDAMSSLGLMTDEGTSKFFNSEGAFVGTAEASQLLHDALEGLTAAQRTELTQTIFGEDAKNAAIALAEKGADGYNNMTAALDKANGVAENAALKQQGFETSLENAKGSVEALQITIGSALLPILGDLLNNYIAPAVNAVTTFAESFFKMVPAIMASDDPLQSFLNALKIAAPGLFDAIVAVEDFKNAITPAVEEIMRLADAFSKGGLGGLIDAVVGDLQAAAPDIAKALGEWGQALIDWIMPMIPPLLKELGDLVDVVWGWIADQAPGWAKQLEAWGEAFVAWIVPMIPPLISELGKMATQFLGWISAQAQPILKSLGDWANSFVAWIVPATVSFLAEWPKMLDQFLDWIGNAAGPILKGLGDWAISFIQWIAPMIPPFLVALGGVALAILTWLVETAVVINKKVLTEWLPAIIGWIATDAIPGLAKALASFLEVFNDWATDTGRQAGIWMHDVGASIIEGIKKGIQDAWSSLSSWLTSKIESLYNVGQDAQDGGSPAMLWWPVGESIVQGIMLGLKDSWPDMVNMIGSFSADLVDEMEDIGRAMNDAIAGGFGATASIDRQLAKNLDDISKIDDAFQKKIATQDLQALLKKSQDLFQDPKAQADYFKMASAHEFELLKIRQQIAEATTDEDKDRLNKQLILIGRAQDAELDQFYKKQQGATSPAQDIANQINDIVAALTGMSLTDDQIAIVDLLGSMYNQIANPSSVPTNPAYTGATSYSNTTNLNMPVYTNNSPRAIHDSMAIAGAALL